MKSSLLNEKQTTDFWARTDLINKNRTRKCEDCLKFSKCDRKIFLRFGITYYLPHPKKLISTFPKHVAILVCSVCLCVLILVSNTNIKIMYPEKNWCVFVCVCVCKCVSLFVSCWCTCFPFVFFKPVCFGYPIFQNNFSNHVALMYR